RVQDHFHTTRRAVCLEANDRVHGVAKPLHQLANALLCALLQTGRDRRVMGVKDDLHVSLLLAATRQPSMTFTVHRGRGGPAAMRCKCCSVSNAARSHVNVSANARAETPRRCTR